jgi:syntaxin-binding protein 5
MVRAYELILPPGTPGGSGYGSHVSVFVVLPALMKPMYPFQDILTARRPPVTALTIHPAGHFFVVGHTDGCLSFWAIEDETQPLLVRTLDTTDVNIVDTEKLDEHLFQGSGGDRPPASEREPIFKLSWSSYSNSSDPRGGDTTLTILGGLHLGDATGLSVLNLPPFNPPEPPVPNPPGSHMLNPFWRTAMRNSLNPSKTYFYYTQEVVQDYLLIPRQSPHFSGTYDPIAILLLTESRGDTRVVEAYQFPPPEFFSGMAIHNSKIDTPLKSEENPTDSLANDLATTLKVLQTSDEPRRLRLPTMLMNGNSGLAHGQLLKLERETYEALCIDNPDVDDGLELPMKGGVAWADEIKTNDLKLSKAS